MSDSLLQLFPGLATAGYRVTSPETIRYNCIAWAASRDDDWWWPHADGYWPPGVPVAETLTAFEAAYVTLGYRRCLRPDFETLYEKVAIYATKNGKPRHAARQLDTGKWTSKLGPYVDIEHATPEAVSGSQYGDAVLFLKRRRSFWRVVRVVLGRLAHR